MITKSAVMRVHDAQEQISVITLLSGCDIW